MAEKQTPDRTLRLPGAAVVLGVGVLLLFSGCGPHEARVAGKVTLDNEPLAGAQVVFVGEEEKNQAPVVAQTDDAGYYKLVGNQGAGIPVGKYKVIVTKMALKDGTIPRSEKLE